MNKNEARIKLEQSKAVREKGKFALRVVGNGHRSEAAILDLVAYARQLEAANARHVINHIENICEKCGHTKTEDGCAHCISQLVLIRNSKR